MILEPRKIIPHLGIGHGMTVVDIGSSVGFWAKPLSHIVGPGKIIAIDRHAEIIQRLNHDAADLGMGNINALQGDIHNLATFPIAPGSADRIILIRMMSVIESNLLGSLEGLARFVKETGNIVIVDHIHHRGSFFDVLRGSNLAITEIPDITSVTSGHFFGVMLRSAHN